MKFFYHHQAFRSHARAALEYLRILGQLWHEVRFPDEADVAFLHYEPVFFPGLLEKFPALKKAYRVGCCVWEANDLPAAWQQHIALMDEIWTPSAYCYDVFSRHHPRVVWIPHVVRLIPRDTTAEETQLRQALHIDSGTCVFFTIAAEGIPRKNTPAVLRAFACIEKHAPLARLLIKTTPDPDVPVRYERHGNVSTVTGVLNNTTLYALYAISDVYVSAHHSEGWGLTLSDAMLFGKAVVATAYSGNMDFMTPSNSFLVRAEEQPIAAEDAYYLFKTPLRWGYVDEADLARQMLSAYRHWEAGTLQTVAEQGHRDIQLYDADHVKKIIASRLEEISAAVRGLR